MRLNNKNILLISPEPWNHIFVSKHHYAIHLGARGNKVFFLNPPTEKQEVKPTGYKNVSEVNYRGFPRGLHYYPFFFQKYITKFKFEQLRKLCAVNFHIIWSFDNSVFYCLSALPNNILRISHVVDLNQNFQIAKAASTADMCLCTTQYIKDILLKYNKNVWKIGHGCTSELIKGEFKLTTPNNRIKVGYAGNLDIMYIDWNLLLKVIESNSHVQFFFAGPLNKQDIKQSLRKHKNITYVGKLTPNNLGGFYQEMDLLILIYKADEYKEQLANPHKLIEYLASGKMVIATQTEEYKQLAEDSLILMSHENKEFPILFDSAIENIAYWNSLEKQHTRQAFALNNTYDMQIDRIENYICNERFN